MLNGICIAVGTEDSTERISRRTRLITNHLIERVRLQASELKRTGCNVAHKDRRGITCGCHLEINLLRTYSTPENLTRTCTGFISIERSHTLAARINRTNGDFRNTQVVVATCYGRLSVEGYANRLTIVI